MKQVLRLLFLFTICLNLTFAQTARVRRNVNLRPDPSTNNDPIELLKPPAKLTLLEPGKTSGFYHVSVPDGKKGFVWANNITITTGETGKGTATSGSTAVGGVPSPLTAQGHPVDWWFVFKFNSASFPGCAGSARPTCPFGGSVQHFSSSSQQYAFASSESKTLHAGNGCLGDTLTDPIGATFDEIYNGTLNYVVWNDQFYQDPALCGSSNSCSAPWGHSKGVIAWNDSVIASSGRRRRRLSSLTSTCTPASFIIKARRRAG